MRDLVKKRKSQVRFCEQLSNGQLLNVYFWCSKDIVIDQRVNVWSVGIIITNT